MLQVNTSAERDPPPAPAAASRQPVLAVRHAAKRFGPVVALADASLICGPGEIHAIMGANGAGKSTLVKILSGVHRPDSGQIEVDGRPVQFESPSHAARLGIATVFQELSLFSSRTVAENIFAGHEPRRFGLVDSRALLRQSAAVLERLGVSSIDPHRLVGDLSLADRQLVEIAKALSHDPRVLILDEGTSSLARAEVAKLFDLLLGLKASGLAILFISHRMPEIREIADGMTVFRDGRDVATGRTEDMSEHRVVELMLGRALAGALEAPPRRIAPTGPPVLETAGMTVPQRLADVSFSLRPGEVLGLAGLEGQGQSDLLLALFGTYRRQQGQIAVDGRPIVLSSPWAAKRAGLALIPAERKTAGALLPLSIRENIALPNLDRMSRGLFVRPGCERERAEALCKRIAVKAASVESPVGTLSGGNQQKIVLAKWLEADPKIFLLNDPTRGIDVGAKAAIYDLIQELAAAGKAIILYSTETAELTALCHRVMVMDRGRITRVLEEEEVTEDNILRTAVGLGRGEQA
jgi:ribose transport system ATP-binding protein